MKQSSWAVPIATLGPLGYAQASGTLATAVTLPLACVLSIMMPSWLYALVVGLLILISNDIISKALEYFREDQDPSQIILDEVLGCLVTFYALPIHIITIIMGFAFFRLFDITKWFGISRAEKLVGALGVIADDLLAAVLANVIIRVIYYFIFGSI